MSIASLLIVRWMVVFSETNYKAYGDANSDGNSDRNGDNPEYDPYI
jgi:ABC-type cobalt transport system substrate-binding protein